MKTLPLCALAALVLASCATTDKPDFPPLPASEAVTATAEQKADIIERIMAMPAFLVHEEGGADFRKRLEAGRASFVDGRLVILSIEGDGSFGKRLFTYPADGVGGMKIAMRDRESEPEQWNVYRYVPATKELKLLFNTPAQD